MEDKYFLGDGDDDNGDKEFYEMIKAVEKNLDYVLMGLLELLNES